MSTQRWLKRSLTLDIDVPRADRLRLAEPFLMEDVALLHRCFKLSYSVGSESRWPIRSRAFRYLESSNPQRRAIRILSFRSAIFTALLVVLAAARNTKSL